jgi:hypothetical protein
MKIIFLRDIFENYGIYETLERTDLTIPEIE